MRHKLGMDMRIGLSTGLGLWVGMGVIMIFIHYLEIKENQFYGGGLRRIRV